MYTILLDIINTTHNIQLAKQNSDLSRHLLSIIIIRLLVNDCKSDNSSKIKMK